MKIRNSKSFFLFYAVLALVLALGLMCYLITESTFNSWIRITCLSGILFFFGVALFLFRKALDKRVIYEIDENGIRISSTGTHYFFSELKFFRYQRVVSRGAASEIIHFYNGDQIKVFRMKVHGTDFNKELAMKLLGKKLRRLQNS